MIFSSLFQQLGVLLDIYKKHECIPSLIDYISFVVFYPQLLAIPLLKKDSFSFQTQNSKPFVPKIKNLFMGIAIFLIGFFKKVFIADNAGFVADAVFGLIEEGVQPNLFEAWLGVIAYSFQIYFNFCGYSDMAVGTARLFNIQLPQNFFSPCKTGSRTRAFWKRLHRTLSIFLKESVYTQTLVQIPKNSFRCFDLFSSSTSHSPQATCSKDSGDSLQRKSAHAPEKNFWEAALGTRKGQIRTCIHLLVIMMVACFSYDSSWMFIIWGSLHGIYLMINHKLKRASFRKVDNQRPTAKWENGADLRKIPQSEKEKPKTQVLKRQSRHKWPLRICISLLVTLIWVFFRANNLLEIKIIFSSLFNFKEICLPNNYINMGTRLGLNLSQFRAIFLIPEDICNQMGILILSTIMVTYFFPQVYKRLKKLIEEPGPKELRDSSFKDLETELHAALNQRTGIAA